MIKDAIDKGAWTPIRLSRKGPKISHLFFTDDLILFGEASNLQVEAILKCLDIFCGRFGQRMNKEKTKMVYLHKCACLKYDGFEWEIGCGSHK